MPLKQDSQRLEKNDKDRTDWERIHSLTDNEIEALADNDLDNPAADEQDWAQAIIGLPARKTRIHASFDQDVVDWFRDQGRGYQTRMNAVLRHYMHVQQKQS
jgi:uncharacterized protein (DUF4415 family)